MHWSALFWFPASRAQDHLSSHWDEYQRWISITTFILKSTGVHKAGPGEEYVLLPSGRRYCSIKAQSARQCENFFHRISQKHCLHCLPPPFPHTLSCELTQLSTCSYTHKIHPCYIYCHFLHFHKLTLHLFMNYCWAFAHKYKAHKDILVVAFNLTADARVAQFYRFPCTKMHLFYF